MMKIAFALCALSALMVFSSFIIVESFAQLLPINEDDTGKLSPCLPTFSAKYFKSKRASRGNLVIINMVPLVTSVIQRQILLSLNEDDSHTFGIMVKNGRKKHGNATAFGVTDKAKSYMMLMLKLEDLELAITQWKSLPTWNPLAHTVVVVLEPIVSKTVKDEIVFESLKKLFEVGIIYANVLYHMQDSEHIMASETWFPYYGDRCADKIEKDDIRKVDECIVEKRMKMMTKHNTTEAVWETKFRSFNEDKYPKLPFSFHDCILKASTFIWEPFVVASKAARKRKKRIESGLEITMLNTITQQMNLKINYKILNTELASRKITDDNQTGIYADLIQKHSDLIVGGLYENPISRQLTSSSIPYFQDDITWCVAKAGLSPTWKNVFIIFNIWTWVGIVITLFITSIVFLLQTRSEGKYRENFVWSLITTLSFSTGQYGHYWPTKFSVQLFMGTLFFYGLHINTAYHSFLINVLQNPRYESQIDTVEKGMEEGLTFFVGENTVAFLEKEDEISQYLLKNHKICHKMDECFAQVSKDSKKAIAVARAHAINNPLGMIDNVDFFCFPVSDDVVIYSTVMMFQRHHPLLLTMNEKIRVISESGLLSKWEKESKFVGKDKIGGKGDGSQNAGGGGGHGGGGKQMKLRLDHVQGAFFLLLLGSSMALVLFLVELFTSRLSRTNAGKQNSSTNNFASAFERLFCYA